MIDRIKFYDILILIINFEGLVVQRTSREEQVKRKKKDS